MVTPFRCTAHLPFSDNALLWPDQGFDNRYHGTKRASLGTFVIQDCHCRCLRGVAMETKVAMRAFVMTGARCATERLHRGHLRCLDASPSCDMGNQRTWWIPGGFEALHSRVPYAIARATAMHLSQTRKISAVAKRRYSCCVGDGSTWRLNESLERLGGFEFHR